MTMINTRLDSARQDLLDLGLRNPLVNYRTLKARGVEIVDEIPGLLFRTLVNDSKTMSFLPAPDKQSTDDADEDDLGSVFGQPDEQASGKIAARHIDNKLQTSYVSTKLQNRLLKTYYAANTYIEERGLNVLYLALGMLHWYESSTSDIVHRAPLILIPVALNRTSVHSRFTISWTGDDIGENISLQTKLRSEFGIDLPTVPDSSELDVERYFETVESAIKGLDRWRVDMSVAAVGFFLFGKLMMYNDLNVADWPDPNVLEEHPVLSSLLGDGFKHEPTLVGIDDNLDDQIDSKSVYHVVDADSSQLTALLDVNAGHNLIIQGPPGTGKSQTIANIIANALGNNKTVLFVAEKMAALEVVKRRLDSVGLGDSCLELHSNHTQKKGVLDELERTLQLGKPFVKTFDEEMNMLQAAKHQLNSYSRIVNSQIGKSRATSFQIYGRLLRLEKRFDKDGTPILDTIAWDQWDSDEFSKMRGLVDRMQSHLSRIGVPQEHPFWGSGLKVITPIDKVKLIDELSRIVKIIKDIGILASDLANKTGFASVQTRSEVNTLCLLGKLIAESPPFEQIRTSSDRWRTDRSDLNELILAGMRHADLHGQYDDWFLSQAWQRDVIHIRQALVVHGQKRWKSLVGSFRQARNELRGLSKKDLPKDSLDLIAMVDAIMEARVLEATIEKHATLGQDVFGMSWLGTKSDWQKLRLNSDWVLRLFTDIDGDDLRSSIIKKLTEGIERKPVGDLTSKIENQLVQLGEACTQTLRLIELDFSIPFGRGADIISRPFADMNTMANDWLSQVDRLQEMVSFNHISEELKTIGLEVVRDLAITWPDAALHLVDVLDYNWYSSLLGRSMREQPILAGFNGSEQSQTVNNFRRLDIQSLNHSRTSLAVEHWQKLPQRSSAGQLNVLYREFQKKRRHLPIRQLIQQAGFAIQAIKPVFMMSPMSIATYLPPGTLSFDLVIFDEASQVKPVDAFGAILRGKQTVVVGDSKQLPPTRFFDAMVGDDADDDVAVADMESILGLFSAQGAKEQMLSWHYRSRHESLIAVSNREFYSNKLITFPSPDVNREGLGLTLQLVSDSFYDRGRSRTNLQEAVAVAKAVMRHARNHPEWSIGVATFSTAQMQAVLDQMEILRRQDDGKETFFDNHTSEPFFVKNLENVQGDERDVILISVGYGKDRNGVLSMNFGPINQDGGERRLNVLMTRARRRCVIFSNLTADDIDLTKTNSKGVASLKQFLYYAETGMSEDAIPTGNEADSIFEEVVADSLRDLNYQVVNQVGSAGFRIDLAVVDDEHPGRYVLGIQCDGASYHSAHTARDRDRIRHAVLTDLGWQIYHIWSTDWFNNPSRELSKLTEFIEKTKIEAASITVKLSDSVKLEPLNLNRDMSALHTNGTISSIPYLVAKLTRRSGGYDILAEPSALLAEYVFDVVVTEGPVHLNIVAQRIISHYGISRLGNRIQDALFQAVKYAIVHKGIRQDNDFLSTGSETESPVRDRSRLSSAQRKFEYIAPKEIGAAIEAVIIQSYGIGQDDIPLQVCQLFGFKRTSDDMRQAVQQEVDRMIASGRIVIQGEHLTLDKDR